MYGPLFKHLLRPSSYRFGCSVSFDVTTLSGGFNINLIHLSASGRFVVRLFYFPVTADSVCFVHTADDSFGMVDSAHGTLCVRRSIPACQPLINLMLRRAKQTQQWIVGIIIVQRNRPFSLRIGFGYEGLFFLLSLFFHPFSFVRLIYNTSMWLFCQHYFRKTHEYFFGIIKKEVKRATKSQNGRWVFATSKIVLMSPLRLCEARACDRIYLV